MLKKIFLIAVLGVSASASFAQVKMRDVFAQLPDSVLPLMTKNNRLDCIDFIENNMEARVKNRFDESLVLESLTSDYLLVHTSASSFVEMKLVPQAGDTLICVNRTYLGPAADSDVRLYTMEWNYVRTMSRPAVEKFYKSADAIQPWKAEMADTMRMVRAQAQYLPLVKASLSKDNCELNWSLQTQEFDRSTKKVAEKYLQPVVVKL